jgi:heme A synthase
MKKYIRRGFVGGVIVAIIPAIFMACKIIIWPGILAGFLGGSSQKNITDIIDNPTGFISLSVILWVVFALILGIIGALIGWFYSKSKVPPIINK